jgi:hypothetical protein
MRRNPRPRKKAHPLMMILGPNLSLKVPRRILADPCTRKPNDAAPEMVALDHPNSWINGSKKTPKLLLTPQTTACMKKPATIMV